MHTYSTESKTITQSPAAPASTSTTTPRGPASSWTAPRPRPTENPWALQDRRKHRRFPVERPGKVYRRATQQFAPARSRDLSFSGALLEVESARPFDAGEIVDVGLVMTRGGGEGGGTVVPKSCLVQAIVVRAEAIDPSRQTVALRYIDSGAAKLVA